MSNQRPPMDPTGDEVQAKLGPTLRRLLALDDEEIDARVRRDRERLDQARQQLDDEVAAMKRTMRTDDDRRAIERFRRLRMRAVSGSRLLAPVLREEIAPFRVRAIVRFTGNRSDLEAMGLQVRSRAQDVFTIVGTRAQLTALAAQPACRSLRAPRPIGPDVEHASAQAEVAAVHQPRPVNPTGFQGDGVLVGVADSPLDVTHHGFRDPAGTHGTRVLYYWVQVPYTIDAMGDGWTAPGAPGQTPEQWYLASPLTRPDFTGLDYGRLYTQADIDTALGLAATYGDGANQICAEPFAEEHGTHCTGIAAGSGHVANWATAPTHVGAAPEATIIHVTVRGIPDLLDGDDPQEDSLLDAIDFCFRAAAFENIPISMSVSQGTSFGPHNGTSEFDQARDRLLDSFMDRAIAQSAGNDNNDFSHRAGTIGAGATDSFTCTSQRTPGGNVWLDVWSAGPELDYQISHGGSNSGWRTAGLDYSGVLAGRDVDAGRDLDSGGNLKGIRLFFDDTLLNDIFTVELRNPHASDGATYHAWTGHQGWTADLSGATQDEHTIGDLACGKSVLTVGATQKVLPPNPASGELITGYSGAGPTLDGRIKPEIVAVGGAPGASIQSTDSDQNSGYVGKNGTSMATPLVAGAVALLFEAYGAEGLDLNQDTIKGLLTRHANRLNLNVDPAQASYVATERNLYGYGRMRLIEPLDLVLPPTEVDLWVRTAADDFGNEPYPGGCFCGAPDIRVCDAGTDDEVSLVRWGTTYDVKVTVRNLGDSDAVGTDLRLLYTLPHTAPNAWFHAEDAADVKLSETVTVDAMDQEEIVFYWRPEASEIAAPAGDTHFCLLAEVDHTLDPVAYAAAGAGAWAANIKGTNNVALRNVTIQ